MHFKSLTVLPTPLSFCTLGFVFCPARVFGMKFCLTTIPCSGGVWDLVGIALSFMPLSSIFTRFAIRDFRHPLFCSALTHHA
ncbi:hypothetical protein EV426DRAFT_628372 [Tirmania nivea]|nr:hypothetical protein EV426DRAFT_628372 [Tirmania nivea]